MNRKALLVGSAVAAGVGAALLRRRESMDLRGKVVLITGGSRGLGLALAREFASQGARLALCARSQEELVLAERDLAFRASEVFTIPCDVSDSAQVDSMVRLTLERYGALDVLVNNAGVIQVGPIDSMTIQDFETAMDTMFWGVVHTTLAIVPHMRQRGAGRVVNVTSVGAKVSVPHLLPYSCAKFAAAAFSEGMRAELHGTGIKVVTIAPGLMRTGSHLNAGFKGAAGAEATWFSLGASLPWISMDAAKAAQLIVSATRTGIAERTLGAPANLLARFQGLFPGATADLMGMVARAALPHGKGKKNVRGGDTEALKSTALKLLTTLGRRAAVQFRQPGAA